MPYETSYDAGLKPFNPDRNRGKWSSPKDFLFACLGHAFKFESAVIFPMHVFGDLGINGLFMTIILMILCAMPIVLMQSFMGQFSSTGFISSFRLTPLFKGMGYVALAINVFSLSYYSVFGAVPLWFFFHSFQPTLPWSCEENKAWNVMCPGNEERNESIYSLEAPSVEFFLQHVNLTNYVEINYANTTLSWQLTICTLLIWAMAAVVLLKPIEIIGRYIRYSCYIVLSIIGICFLRFIFLPGAIASFVEFFDVLRWNWIDTWIGIPLMTLSVLGPGWGTILTMASFNSFKTDIYKYSTLLCMAQLGVMLALAFLFIFMTGFTLKKLDLEEYLLRFHEMQWMDFLIIPTGLSFLEMPNFWCLLFFGMLVLGCLNLVIVQFVSVLTSVCDEFESLRSFKRAITMGAIGVLALISIYFCSNHGLVFSEIIVTFSFMIQTILNLLLLLVVLWIYGRQRFQRDLKFMTGRMYSTFMVLINRFVTPLLLIIAFLVGVMFTGGSGHRIGIFYVLMMLLFFMITMCMIPGYCIRRIKQTRGMIGARLKRCVRPIDWYPVEPEDRQRYEETFDNPDITYTLTETAGE